MAALPGVQGAECGGSAGRCTSDPITTRRGRGSGRAAEEPAPLPPSLASRSRRPLRMDRVGSGVRGGGNESLSNECCIGSDQRCVSGNWATCTSVKPDWRRAGEARRRQGAGVSSQGTGSHEELNLEGVRRAKRKRFCLEGGETLASYVKSKEARRQVAFEGKGGGFVPL